jgi:hypothetical protein
MSTKHAEMQTLSDVIKELNSLSAQFICPKDTYFARMVEIIEYTLSDHTCHWTGYSDCPDTWDTECGEVWQFMDGGPVDNDVEFCPYCGGVIATSA